MPIGNWNMGRWGLPVNIFALVYTAYVTVVDVPFLSAGDGPEHELCVADFRFVNFVRFCLLVSLWQETLAGFE